MTILTTNINTYLSLLSDDRQILSSKEIQIKHATKYEQNTNKRSKLL